MARLKYIQLLAVLFSNNFVAQALKQPHFSSAMSEPLEARKFRISEHFSPLNAAAGGLAIGTVAASRLMLWGKITGISGILAGIINKPSPVDWAARLAFAGGMVACGSAIEV